MAIIQKGYRQEPGPATCLAHLCVVVYLAHALIRASTMPEGNLEVMDGWCTPILATGMCHCGQLDCSIAILHAIARPPPQREP